MRSRGGLEEAAVAGPLDLDGFEEHAAAAAAASPGGAEEEEADPMDAEDEAMDDVMDAEGGEGGVRSARQRAGQTSRQRRSTSRSAAPHR